MCCFGGPANPFSRVFVEGLAIGVLEEKPTVLIEVLVDGIANGASVFLRHIFVATELWNAAA